MMESIFNITYTYLIHIIISMTSFLSSSLSGVASTLISRLVFVVKHYSQTGLAILWRFPDEENMLEVILIWKRSMNPCKFARTRSQECMYICKIIQFLFVFCTLSSYSLALSHSIPILESRSFKEALLLVPSFDL